MEDVSAYIESSLAVVRQLIERHDWRLLNEVEFAHRLSVRASEQSPTHTEALTKPAINIYCEVWHAACGEQGEQRTRAYTELARFLYDRAIHKYREPDIAQEIVHDAVILVYEQLENCRKPGAFMAFAMLKLWNAATTYFRKRDRARNLEEMLVVPENISSLISAGGASGAPERAVLDADQSRSILNRLEAVMQESPRGQKQLQAVYLKYLYALSDREIAEYLDTDVNNVHVLRSRGMKRLRQDVQLRRLANEIN